MSGRSPERRRAPPALRPHGLSLSIRSEAAAWRTLPGLRSGVGRAVSAALAVSPRKPLSGAELNLLLTDDARMRTVNRDWRGLDKATNVLSFPAAPPARIGQSPVLGDIVLAHETLLREAQAEDKPLASHLAHLVVHGVLHLVGEDHETPEEAQRMEALEVEALALLGIDDPYAGSEPAPSATVAAS